MAPKRKSTGDDGSNSASVKQSKVARGSLSKAPLENRLKDIEANLESGVEDLKDGLSKFKELSSDLFDEVNVLRRKAEADKKTIKDLQAENGEAVKDQKQVQKLKAEIERQRLQTRDLEAARLQQKAVTASDEAFDLIDICLERLGRESSPDHWKTSKRSLRETLQRLLAFKSERKKPEVSLKAHENLRREFEAEKTQSREYKEKLDLLKKAFDAVNGGSK